MSWAWAEALGTASPFQGWLVATMLLSLRLAAVFLLTPLLYSVDMPATVRVAIVLGLAAVLVMGLPESSRPAADLAARPGLLLTACATELALGSMLALGIQTAFAAFSLAGRMLDVQVGFGLGQVIDPLTQQQLPVITSAFNQLAVVVFFLVNGHHALLRGIAFSLERFPLGRGWALEAAAPVVIKQVGALFGMGLALAAPVVACLVLVELALGAVARNLPQMNMFVLGIPVKVLVCIVALSLWFAGIGDTMNRVYASIYRGWDNLFAAAQRAEVRR